MPKSLPSLVIQIDSREQQMWSFPPEDKLPGKVQILGSKVEKLDQGDYCVAGYPDLVVIERKAGFRELFMNMSNKENKDRFEAEMVRFEKTKYKYLVIESAITKDTLSMGIPQIYKGPPAKRVVQWIYELQRKYGIIPIWAGDAGQSIAKMIFKDIARLEL